MPGTKNADEIVVGANGRILVAPVGSTAPADMSADFGSEWIELGYASDEGVTFTVGKDSEPVNVWQSFYSVRTLITGQSAELGFELAQWNRDTVPFAFGGGSIELVTAGTYRYRPPSPGEVDERALAVEFVDGDETYRIIVPKGTVSEEVETTINKSPNSVLPITFAVQGQEGVDPFYIDSDVLAMAPLGSS